MAKKTSRTMHEVIKIGDITVFELREVAERLKISPNTARRYVRQGRLFAQKVGVRWLVSEDAIREFFLSEYRKPGLTKKGSS